ncbi:MAG: AraC family transcriptional regulator [Lentisphaeria bacterium]|nr:AraC family transcriptional regulator [Lentisphaeria bacterium]
MTQQYREYFFAAYKMNTRFYVRSVGNFVLRDREEEYVKKAEFPEIFWCVEGSGEFQLDGKHYILKKDQIWYYPPGSIHKISCADKLFHYRWLALDGPASQELFEGLNLKPGLNPGKPCPQHLFSTLTLNIGKLSPADQMQNLVCAFQILACAATLNIGTELPLVEQVKTIIENNFQNPDLNVEKIADLLHVSRTSLSRTFSNSQKITIVEYLSSRRIKEAIQLLKETDEPIREIARKCGYTDHGYFTKVIKKITGLSPRYLRKKPSAQ